MEYYSIFDKIEDASAQRDGRKVFEDFGQMRYSGTLESVLDTLERDISQTTPNSKTLVRIAFNAARIVRAAIDNKVSEKSAESELLLVEALDLAIEIYKNSDRAEDKIREFRKKVSKNLLGQIIFQRHDTATWEATAPHRSQETANRIADRQKGSDIMMIALAHGGVAAGIDVYLRYCDITKSEGSILYTVRFSTQKLGDKEPKLTEREKRALKGLGEERNVIIFDEDTCSGNTITSAQRFFREKVFGREVEAQVNLEMVKSYLEGFDKKTLGGPITYAVQNYILDFKAHTGSLQITDPHAIEISDMFKTGMALGPSIGEIGSNKKEGLKVGESLEKYQNFLFELNNNKNKPPKYFEKNLLKI